MKPVDVIADEERRQAARALLLAPLIAAGGVQADTFRLVRKHREWLEQSFGDGLGYRLLVEPRFARLFKAGLGRDGSRPMRRRPDAPPLTPRAYALFCLLVAALTRSKSQMLIDELVAEVRSTIADAGLDIDLDRTADRRALYSALVVLLQLGALSERDGDLARWVEDTRAQSLLDVNRDVLRLLVSAPLSATTSADELLSVAALPSAAGGARVAIRRRLIESPILSVTDLNYEQSEWWARNRNRERDWFSDRFGLELELRAEGAIAVDPDDELTDFAFPAGGSSRHAALLILEGLVTHLRDGARAADAADRVWRAVPEVIRDDVVSGVHARYGAAMRRELRESTELMCCEARDVLVGMGLVRVDHDGIWHIHASAARYSARPTLTQPGPAGQDSLFIEGDP
jgi:uncharacterized protein (TIGR02678 family)